MPLQEYKRKRNFTLTPEPGGAGSPRRARTRRGLTFVIQKHDASRLHYDFRLEWEGVLKSWAVPKGPSLNPADRRLAVEVEDHPLEYGDFEGIIPEGQYGGGTVMLWDRGTWTPLDENPSTALRRGKLTFTLDGTKLRGAWSLVRIRSRDDDEKNNWLLMKQNDEHASTSEDILLQDRSVKTKRTLPQIASGKSSVWESNRGSASSARASSKGASTAAAKRPTRSRERRSASTPASKGRVRRKDADPSSLSGARAAPMPRTVSPQLCTLVDHAPVGEQWLHEIKLDGYRILAWKTSAGVRLITRSGLDWTSRFTPIARAIEAFPAETCLIDGEATIVDPEGRTSFQRLQQAIKGGDFESLAYFVFDLLYCEGYDLRGTPLIDRKQLLASLAGTGRQGVLRYNDHVVGAGGRVETSACRLHLEGIISKRIHARYSPTRSDDWLKIKCTKRQEFIIVGWTPPQNSRKHFGSLLLAAHDAEGRLIYTGRVGTGFTEALLADIMSRLKAIAVREMPLDVTPPRSESRDANWVQPRLVAEVEFTEWTDDGRLRHPSFQGLREDKPAAQVRIERPTHPPVLSADDVGAMSMASTAQQRSKEEPVATGTTPASGRVRRTTAKSAETGRENSRQTPRTGSVKRSAKTSRKSAAVELPVIRGITITNPDRIVDEETGLTKFDLVRYYDQCADWILPFLVDRPLSTVRCPAGRGGGCFFQKHLGDTFSKPVRPMRVKEKSGNADYISIDSAEGLITLIQFGVIELHPWGSTRRTIEQPDVLTFDLDPGPGVTTADVKAGALRVREILESVGLRSFLKTSGGKGLHVIVPLTPDADWDTAKAFTHAVATLMTRENPGKFIDTLSKAKREGRIFVDYLRNGRGATSVAPYTARARPNLPVSMPIPWEALPRLRAFNAHTIRNAMKTLTGRTDPWTDYWKVKQRLNAKAPKMSS